MFEAAKELVHHGICFSLPPVLRQSLGICENPFTKRDPTWWWQYHYCYWTVRSTDIYEKVACKHFTPLWEKSLGLYNNVAHGIPKVSVPYGQPRGSISNISANTTVKTNQVAGNGSTYLNTALEPFTALVAEIQALHTRIRLLEDRLLAAGCIRNYL